MQVLALSEHWCYTQQMCVFVLLNVSWRFIFRSCAQSLVNVGVNVWLVDLPCLNSVFLCYCCVSLKEIYKSVGALKIHLH